MDVVLIPGFWLDASSWDGVVGPLRAAGHAAHQLTLPGLERTSTDRASITFRDHVEAVVRVVDGLAGRVVLVGHSGGGPIAHSAVDARPDRVARVVYVDCVPNGEGECINDELPALDGEIPLPDWSAFGDEDLVDMDEAQRERFQARAIPQPARVATDPQQLADTRRHDVPITVIACEFPSEQVRTWIAEGQPWVAELAAIKDVEYIDLPTGHWPQFTKPAELAAAILAAIDRGQSGGS